MTRKDPAVVLAEYAWLHNLSPWCPDTIELCRKPHCLPLLAHLVRYSYQATGAEFVRHIAPGVHADRIGMRYLYEHLECLE